VQWGTTIIRYSLLMRVPVLAELLTTDAYSAFVTEYEKRGLSGQNNDLDKWVSSNEEKGPFKHTVVLPTEAPFLIPGYICKILVRIAIFSVRGMCFLSTVRV
jgi:hypothetical protein